MQICWPFLQNVEVKGPESTNNKNKILIRNLPFSILSILNKYRNVLLDDTFEENFHSLCEQNWFADFK